MASSQGGVRSSPMAYPAVRPLPKLPLRLGSRGRSPRSALGGGGGGTWPSVRARSIRRASTAAHPSSHPLARSRRCATKPSCDVMWISAEPRAPTASFAFSAAARLPSALPASRSTRESAAYLYVYLSQIDR
eukprot:scaffold76546_cov106-Phaeocystis_antarctica.AAC.2